MYALERERESEVEKEKNYFKERKGIKKEKKIRILISMYLAVVLATANMFRI